MPTLLRTILLLGMLAPPTPGQGSQFVARTPAPLATAWLHDIVAADFDGDGDLDLCGPSNAFFTPSMNLWRNDGAAGFVDLSATLPSLPLFAPVQQAVPLDIEGDGDLDLLLLSVNRLWRNLGAMTFADATANLPAGYAGGSLAEVEDFDGDGDADVATIGFSVFGNSSLLVNQGTGVFALAAGTSLPLGNSAAAADFDQDGDFDLAVLGANGVLMRRNDGNLLFTDVTSSWLSTPLALASRLAVGDLDGNGTPELLVATSAGLVQLRFQAGSFVVASTMPGIVSAYGLAVADVDLDDDLDVLLSAQLVGTTTPRLELAVNDGAGNLALAPSRLSQASVQPAVLAAGDLDGDGDTDCVVADHGAPAQLLVNRHLDLVPGQPVIGQTWNVQIASAPGYATLHHAARLAIALAALPGPATIPGVGNLWLDLGAGYTFVEGTVLASTGQCSFTFAVPALPALVGLPLHVQGLAEQARAPVRLTAYHRVVVQ